MHVHRYACAFLNYIAVFCMHLVDKSVTVSISVAKETVSALYPPNGRWYKACLLQKSKGESY